MAQIVTKRLVKMQEVEAILEDNLPHCDLEKEFSNEDFKSTLRVRKSTNIGAKVFLSVHSIFFSRENVQKLKESGIADSLLDDLEQSADAAPILADGLQAYLKQTLNSRMARELLREHKTTIYKTCALNSLITISEWDPNEFWGLLTGGDAFHISNRMEFEKELGQLLSANIEHVSSENPGGCFIATAASGDSNDPSVVVLRRYRDQRLAHTPSGRLFIRVYETWGPMIARMIRYSRLARRITYAICVRPSARLVSSMAGTTGKDETKQGE